ncbi:MAG TPA: hypothetical protein ENI96_14895 [Sedimenticola thiotaurini]|uniref:Uncharacterized protein n=1 Tax=Sedimenticola thiotaurini TaxID=1543721 RepID=A0A831RQ65_9GAMM|nr:hypothetical protein [Sedimenticola thiotaurini]
MATVPAALLPLSAAAVLDHAVDPETGLQRWHWNHRGVSLQLVQRQPDQTRAFFLGRGFGTSVADRIGRSCVFQTIFRNDGRGIVEYDLDRWKVIRDGRTQPPLTRERWSARLQSTGVPQGPLIALRWSLLPTRQRFQPGDYNWGMISFGPAPGEQFDLTIELDVGGNRIDARIPAIECPPEQP